MYNHGFGGPNYMHPKLIKRCPDYFRIVPDSLTLPVLIPDEEKKLTYIFIFRLLCGASKGFMKPLRAFIKPFEAPQRSLKIKI